MSTQSHQQLETEMFFRLATGAIALMKSDRAPASVEAEELRDDVDLLAEMTEQHALRAQALRLLDRLDVWRAATH